MVLERVFGSAFFSKTPSITKFMWRRWQTNRRRPFVERRWNGKIIVLVNKFCPCVNVSISNPIRTDLISKPTPGLTRLAIIRMRLDTVFCGHFGEFFLAWKFGIYTLWSKFFIFSNFLRCIMSIFEKMTL